MGFGEIKHGSLALELDGRARYVCGTSDGRRAVGAGRDGYVAVKDGHRQTSRGRTLARCRSAAATASRSPR
nr:hypothetical protein [uncultured bacterium]